MDKNDEMITLHAHPRALLDRPLFPLKPASRGPDNLSPFSFFRCGLTISCHLFTCVGVTGRRASGHLAVSQSECCHVIRKPDGIGHNSLLMSEGAAQITQQTNPSIPIHHLQHIGHLKGFIEIVQIVRKTISECRPVGYMYLGRLKLPARSCHFTSGCCHSHGNFPRISGNGTYFSISDRAGRSPDWGRDVGTAWPPAQVVALPSIRL